MIIERMSIPVCRSQILEKSTAQRDWAMDRMMNASLTMKMTGMLLARTEEDTTDDDLASDRGGQQKR